MPDESNVAVLILKSMRNDLTTEERDQLTAWLNQSEKNRRFYENEINGGVANGMEHSINMNEDRMDRGMAARMQADKRAGRIVTFRRMIAAACLATLLITGAWIYHIRSQASVTNLSAPLAARMPSNPAPGTHKALLTLSDGSDVLLDSTHTGAIARQGATEIIRQAGDQLSYKTTAGASSIGYNTISTPRGGEYQVTLPDGTKVWLNAGSSIHFPTAFSGHTRTVEMTGEAYFEVAKKKDQPFHVSVRGIDVAVLGTSFNIMAYPEEETTRTTLLSGAVQVSNNGENAVLHPGQEARIADKKLHVIEAVNPEEAIAWKNGYFEFNSADLGTVMRALGRWYDVDIQYQSREQQDSHRFTGQISRQSHAQEALQILTASGYHFTIQGKTITVLP